MIKRKHNLTVNFLWFTMYLLISACVEKVEFDIPPAATLTVIEGMISDGPGPYTVKVSRGLQLDAGNSRSTALQGAKVSLYDDEGNMEELTEATPGEYVTGGLIRGKQGHSYYIEVHTPDGDQFVSAPEQINPVGQIENIFFEYEARTVVKPFGEVPADVFNIYLDAQGTNSNEQYVRWKFQGTYKVITYPSLRETHVPPYTPYKDPPPCSGYVVVGGPIGSGGLLRQVGECTCCTCWISQYEELPQLSDGQLIRDNRYNRIKVAEVPINNTTFHEKFLVEVHQMSLTRNAYDFFNLIKEQKENASNLFQAPPGEIRGNIKSQNSNARVIGIFWATSISSKSIYIKKEDVPYPVTPIAEVKEACTFYPDASTTKPDNWE